MDLRAAGLWTRQPFALLWTGQTVSQLGSEITLVALPLTAIIVLGASPIQVGLLTASGLRAALAIAALGTIAGAATLLRSPLWTGWRVLEQRQVDEPAEGPTGEPPTRSPAMLWRFAGGSVHG
jgi:hypothetical protein